MNKKLKNKKEYKRLIKLLYKKGYITKYFGEIKTKDYFYWENYYEQERLYYCELDYWGEAYEIDIARCIIENEIYSNFNDLENTKLLFSKKRCIFNGSYNEIINFLSKLPNKVNNHKINLFLK